MAKPSRFRALIEEIGLDRPNDEVSANEVVDELSARERSVFKLLRQIVDCLIAQAGVLAAQGRDIKALRAELAELKGNRAQPMRKALQPLSGSSPIRAEEFLTKAIFAQEQGRLSGLQVAVAESCINAGVPPPTEILQAVLA
jgi:hypothetical protein